MSENNNKGKRKRESAAIEAPAEISAEQPAQVSPEAIAVVGMACVFPAAADLTSYWRLICNSVEGTTIPLLPHTFAEVGAAVQATSASHLLRDTVTAALKDAEHGKQRRLKILADAEAKKARKSLVSRNKQTVETSTAAAPRMLLTASGIDTADVGSDAASWLGGEVKCNSSAAVHAIETAISALRAQHCDVAVAAGVQLLPGAPHSHDGQAGNPKPYAADATGLINGEGAGAIVCKRLVDAERDGDRIYAVIRGMGMAQRNDAQPATDVWKQALQSIYEQLQIEPKSIAFIEGDGAGDPATDTLELDAMHQVFGTQGFPTLLLGTVKSLVAHTGAAAPIASMIKMVLALYHRVLPPTVGAEPLHPQLTNSRIYVRPMLSPWIAMTEAKRVGAINMVDADGACAHMLLEEPAEPDDTWCSLMPFHSELFVITAASRAELIAQVGQLRQALTTIKPHELGDFAFTLVQRIQTAHRFRLAMVARNIKDLGAQLSHAERRLSGDTSEQWADNSGVCFGSMAYKGKLAILFSGVGFPGLSGSYADRVGELVTHFPALRKWLDSIESASVNDGVPYPLRFQLYPPSYFDPEHLALIEEALKWSQRAAIGTQASNMLTFELMESLGIVPDAMAGFSLGEWSALVAAGLIDSAGVKEWKDSFGTEVSTPAADDPDERGTWAMVSAGASDVKSVLQPLGEDITIAIDVSPGQVFIGGCTDPMNKAVELLKGAGIWCYALPSEGAMGAFSAFHTPRAAKFTEKMREAFAELPMKPLNYPVYSAVSAALFPQDPEGIVALIVQNATKGVRLRETIKKMHREGFRMFVQLGGGGKLLPTVEKILGLEPYLSMSIDMEHMPGLQQMQSVVARMFALGISMKPAVLFRYRDCRVLNLPTAGSSPRLAPAVSPAPDNAPRLVATSTTVQPVKTPTPPPSVPKVSPPLSSAPTPAATPAMRAPAVSPSQENTARHVEKSAMPVRMTGAAVAQLTDIEEPAIEVDDALDVLQQLAELDREEEARYATLVERMMQTGESIQASPSAVTDKPSAHAPVRYPLVGDINHLISGQELRSRLLLDLKLHRFLAEHSLLPVPDQLKHKRELLPTLAFVFGLEIMLEAAQTLVPYLRVVACENVEQSRFVMLHSADTLAMWIHAKRTSEFSVAVEFGIEGDNKPVCHSTVMLAEELTAAPELMNLHYDQPCPHSSQWYYDEGPLFQDPTWRVLRSFDRMSAHSINGTLVLSDPRDFFYTQADKSTPEPTMIFDPILLDGVAQMLGYPQWEEKRRLIIPISMKRISFHSHAAKPGALVRAAIRHKQLDDRRTEADFDVVAADGSCIMHVEGWREWWVIWPKCFLQTNHRPRDSYIANPVTMGSEDMVTYRVHRSAFGDTAAEWVARVYLTQDEWNHYQAQPQLDWLLGRVAAKDAVRGWFKKHRNKLLHPLEVTLANLPSGAPVVVMPDAEKLFLSISHIDNEAIAVVSATQAVGVDITTIKERDQSWFDLAFDREELQLLPATERLRWAHDAWAAKEAVVKLYGVGYQGLGDFRIRELSPSDSKLKIVRRSDGRIQEVRSLRDGSCVIALATEARVQPNVVNSGRAAVEAPSVPKQAPVQQAAPQPAPKPTLQAVPNQSAPQAATPAKPVAPQAARPAPQAVPSKPIDPQPAASQAAPQATPAQATPRSAPQAVPSTPVAPQSVSSQAAPVAPTQAAPKPASPQAVPNKPAAPQPVLTQPGPQAAPQQAAPRVTSSDAVSQAAPAQTAPTQSPSPTALNEEVARAAPQPAPTRPAPQPAAAHTVAPKPAVEQTSSQVVRVAPRRIERSVLEVTQLEKSYKNSYLLPALSGVSFDVREGETLGLVGPNGAGKTTLIRALMGRTSLDHGSIKLFGSPVEPSVKPSHRIGWVPQELALYPLLSARKNLLTFGKYQGLSEAELEGKIEDTLRWAGLIAYADQPVGELLPGMMRRLSICTGILHEPELLLLDEPTSAMNMRIDAESRQRIYQMLNSLHSQGVSILCATREVDEELEGLCDRVVLLDYGRVICEGYTQELIESTVGSKREVEIHSDVLADDLRVRLQERGFVISDKGIRTRASDTGAELQTLLDELRRENVTIKNLIVKQPTLASVFLQLTGRELGT